MNILVIHDKPPLEVGGMSRIIALQNALLEKAGHQITTVICAQGDFDGTRQIPPSGRRTGKMMIEKFDQLIDECKPDLIHIHSGYFAVGPLLMAHLARRLPLIYTLHDVTPLCPRMTKLTRQGALCSNRQGWACITSVCYSLNDQNRPLSNIFGLMMRVWQNKALHALSTCIVPSHYLGAELERSGMAADRIHVVPHFIQAPIHPPNTTLEPRILFAGRLVEEKGIKILLQALSHLRATAWQLHIAGDGPLRGWLENEIAQGGFSDHIKLLPMLDPESLAQEYQAARLVVMPSLIPESFGLVGLEALSAGRPVAGFCSGGMAEWLIDDVSGLVATWGNAISLANAIDRLLGSPDLCQRLGWRGFELVKQKFSPESHSARLLEVFNHERAAFQKRRAH